MGVAQLAPLMMMKPLLMQIVEITCQHWRAGHLHHQGNLTPQGQIKLYSLALEVTSLNWQSPQDTTTHSELLEASPDEEQPAGDLGQLIDAWPSLDQALDEIFAPPAED